MMGLYILVSPYLPALDYKIHKGNYAVPAYVQAAQSTSTTTGINNIPTDNRLAIPKIGVDTPIYEGPTVATLNKGVWHRPRTPTPLENGNTVIAGHRFGYNPSVKPSFYNLDKLVIGDPIIVAWDKKLVSYKVTEVKIVSPEHTEIEANTPDKRLTLYTCTPLWTSKNRLVVIAKPVGDTL